MGKLKKGKAIDFQAIFAAAPDLYLILDPDFHIIDASAAYLKATMVRREDIIGKNAFDVFPQNPDDAASRGAQNLRESLEHVLKNKKPDIMAVQKYDIRKPPSEGGIFEVRYWSPINTPVLGSDHNVKYIIHRVEDVTEYIRLKQSGNEQRKIMQKLRTKTGMMEMEIYKRAQEIQDINKKLQEANKHLEKINQIKTQFFANISHELRTPLMLILGPLEKVLMEAHLSPDLLQHLQLIARNARILLKHVNDLLDVAKLEAGKMPIRYAEVDLAQLTRQICALFEERIKEHELSFSLSAPKELRVEIDPDKMQRVLMNLLSNAIKFTPFNGEIKLKLKPYDAHVRITIADTSPGIPAALCSSIFERFFQVEESSTRHYGGTGLGLAIVKDFIELHGGTITVDNAPKGGAIFTIDLPINAPTGTIIHKHYEKSVILEKEIVPQLIAELKSQKNLTEQNKVVQQTDVPLILVVEDNIDMNHFICDILANNYRTVSALNGADGLQKALDLHPDLIVSDMMMPKMNGVQFVHAVRQHPELLTTPIIILTAKADDTLCIQMLREGAQDYMVKPFSPNEFKARIANLILTKKAEDELERFVYLASHDIKAPLPAIERLITWIEEDTGDKLPEPSKKHLALLRGRAYRMSILLDGLLKFSQVGHTAKEISTIDTKQLVNDIIQELKPPSTFTFKCAKNLPVLKTTTPFLRQVFSALIDNSIKHHHRKDGHITIGANEYDDAYEFFVKDDGPGIEPAYHARIFELFQTLKPRDIFESSGVGLSIAKKIVESQGGKITVDSAKNKGATFKFTWPKKI